MPPTKPSAKKEETNVSVTTRIFWCAYRAGFGIRQVLIALGIVGFLSHVVFSIVGWVIAFILVLVEVPLCMRMCPTNDKFDTFIRYFENTLFRAIMYLCFAVVMFLSSLMNTGPLIAAGVSLLLAALCYGELHETLSCHCGFATVKGQGFASSSMLGGTGVDNVV
ncbi:hypothetical protein INT44_004320 [Umbelopsis vinacea]|uniref:Golgi apparatus membrane protein TVP18 n=1 Tax=Umbelopsis vinacea TaxID=44442 RepID=A0A8H7QCI8_9FUNG|nr:hypothetical protein INT44_004320 [Umbelopsis vinacea]